MSAIEFIAVSGAADAKGGGEATGDRATRYIIVGGITITGGVHNA